MNQNTLVSGEAIHKHVYSGGIPFNHSTCNRCFAQPITERCTLSNRFALLCTLHRKQQDHDFDAQICVVLLQLLPRSSWSPLPDKETQEIPLDESAPDVLQKAAEAGEEPSLYF